MLRIFDVFVASRVSHWVYTFTFHCSVPRRSPVGNIRRPDNQVKYVAVVCSVRLWDRGHNGSLWVHPSAVINLPPESGNINTTIQNPDGGVFLGTVSRSGLFLEVDDCLLNSGVRPILCVGPECVCYTYKPSYVSSQRQDLRRLFCDRHPILSDTFTKRCGNSS